MESTRYFTRTDLPHPGSADTQGIADDLLSCQSRKSLWVTNHSHVPWIRSGFRSFRSWYGDVLSFLRIPISFALRAWSCCAGDAPVGKTFTMPGFWPIWRPSFPDPGKVVCIVYHPISQYMSLLTRNHLLTIFFNPKILTVCIDSNLDETERAIKFGADCYACLWLPRTCLRGNLKQFVTSYIMGVFFSFLIH